MKSFQEMYNEKKTSAEKVLELIQDNDYMFSAQAAGEPAEILSHLQHLKTTGVKNVILNTCQFFSIRQETLHFLLRTTIQYKFAMIR